VVKGCPIRNLPHVLVNLTFELLYEALATESWRFNIISGVEAIVTFEQTCPDILLDEVLGMLP
jgi:hypothetical protein